MEEFDALALLAEIFAAFAGFTGIVAVLGQRYEGRWRPVDVVRFRGLLETSLAGLILSVLPIGLQHLGLDGPVLWRFCSALVATYIAFYIARTILMQRSVRADADPDFVPNVRVLLVSLSVVVFIAQAASVFGALQQLTFAVFLMGLIYCLVACATMFVLLLRFVRMTA